MLGPVVDHDEASPARDRARLLRRRRAGLRGRSRRAPRTARRASGRRGARRLPARDGRAVARPPRARSPAAWPGARRPARKAPRARSRRSARGTPTRRDRNDVREHRAAGEVGRLQRDCDAAMATRPRPRATGSPHRRARRAASLAGAVGPEQRDDLPRAELGSTARRPPGGRGATLSPRAGSSRRVTTRPERMRMPPPELPEQASPP